MNTILKWVVACGVLFTSAISIAAGGGTLTKDEKVLTLVSRLGVFENIYSASIRKASISGQKAVVPNLELVVTDENGQKIADGSLPATLANLEADLKNTDIQGELRNAGLRIDPQTSQAPHLTIYVIGTPAVSKPELRARKLYLIGGVVSQTATLGSGKRELLTTGTYLAPTIISTDDTDNAQTIRVAVRKIVDQYIQEASGK